MSLNKYKNLFSHAQFALYEGLYLCKMYVFVGFFIIEFFFLSQMYWENVIVDFRSPVRTWEEMSLQQK